MATWGSTTIKVLVSDPYQPAYTPPNIVEIPILCDPAELDVPASIIQGNGRNRKQVQGVSYVAAIADYATLQADLTAQTVRTWTGPEAVALSCVIKDLQPEYVQGDFIRFQMLLMEAV